MISSKRVCIAVLAQSLRTSRRHVDPFARSLDSFNPGSGLVSMSVCCAVHHHRCSSSVRDLMKYRFATCTIPSMKQRNFRRWIAVAVLGAHVFVPFAAYASVKAGTVFGDVCSVFGKAQPPTATPVGLPAQGSDRHTADHC